jgi:hypothetical protein
MPTYSFRCTSCGRIDELLLSIRDYSANPPALFCCAERMGRYFDSAPGLANVGDRSYDGMRAPDGTDISSRAKHRAYMKANNLTTVDDFASTWKRDAEVRAARLEGHDPSRKNDLAEALQKLGG